MNPFEIDPGWYDRYWYSDRPQPKRRSFSGSAVRFAVLVLLLGGSGLALSNYHVQSGTPQYQDWEQE
jgi:hypothetical protein